VADSLAVERQLQALLDQKEYFKLQPRLKASSSDLKRQKFLYFRAFIDSAFNRNEECVKDVDTLLKDYNTGLTDSTRFVLLNRLQGDSYFKLYQYAKAAQNDSTILDHSKAISRCNGRGIK
jgi:hypothetical protein